jgi:Dolichyl-phosphate-mannose-protein mannosyltransferase
MRRATTPVSTALQAGAAAGVVLVAATAPFLGRYGWDRDELYFLSASRHPALGYVDFPPITAWVAWIVRQLAGDSLVALRLVSLACGVGSVFFAALIARELGGRRWAQFGAALAWAVTPFALGSASIFHPTFFDALAWTAFLYLATRILVRPDPRLWWLLGVVAGLGLEAKYTIVFLFAALAIALAAFDRQALRSRGPWLAAAIALLLSLPNLYWQVRHGWPSLHFASSQNTKTADDTSRPAYIAEQILFLGGVVVVAAIGIVWLWRRHLRVLAAVPVLVTLAFLVERGRGYYAIPADVVAVAAGAVALEGWSSTRRRVTIIVVAVLQVVVLVLAGPVIVPVLSTRAMVSRGIWKQSFYKDEIGWPELTTQVVDAWDALPASSRADGAVVAHNYGEASALDLFGRGRLPLVLSGHLSWQYWRPAALPERHLLTVGFYPDELQRLCSSWRVVAHVSNHLRLANEELGRPIAACTLKRPLGALWSTDFASDSL